MSKAENQVVNSVTQVADLYRVKWFRMQSRVMTVPGAAGRDRPMFFGQWIDDFGNVHYSGMADLLLRPRVQILPPPTVSAIADEFRAHAAVMQKILDTTMTPTVLLWVECKTGKNKNLSPDQEAFRHDVQQNGEYFLHIHDDLRPLMAWFEEHGIKEGGRR